VDEEQKRCERSEKRVGDVRISTHVDQKTLPIGEGGKRTNEPHRPMAPHREGREKELGRGPKPRVSR